MTAPTKAASPATKYRVKIRKIAVANEFAFTQVTTATDRFTKGSMTIDVHHGPSNLITSAEIVKGNAITVIKGDRKMFRVRDALTGVKDDTYLRIPEDEVVELESGRGIAKIAVKGEPAPAAKPAAKAAPGKATPKPKAAPAKGKAAPKPEAVAKPKPRPTPAAPKTAEAVAQAGAQDEKVSA